MSLEDVEKLGFLARGVEAKPQRPQRRFAAVECNGLGQGGQAGCSQGAQLGQDQLLAHALVPGDPSYSLSQWCMRGGQSLPEGQFAGRFHAAQFSPELAKQDCFHEVIYLNH